MHLRDMKLAWNTPCNSCSFGHGEVNFSATFKLTRSVNESRVPLSKNKDRIVAAIEIPCEMTMSLAGS
jgi:hypothetical protein